MKSLLEPEYSDVYNAWLTNPNSRNRSALSSALDPVIKRMVQAAGGDVNDPVIVAKARMTALFSMTGYNPQKAKLNNYLYSQLLGLNRVLGTANNIIRIPESVVLDRKKLDKAESELADSLGYWPSTTQLADSTGLSVKRITKLRQAIPPMASSQLKTDTGAPYEPAAKILGDTAQQDAWAEYVYDSLDDRKRAIMERLYGMHGLKRQKPQQIAQALNISTSAVSQQRKKIDAALNSELQFGLFR